jgi:hypothetical protein
VWAPSLDWGTGLFRKINYFGSSWPQKAPETPIKNRTTFPTTRRISTEYSQRESAGPAGINALNGRYAIVAAKPQNTCHMGG